MSGGRGSAGFGSAVVISGHLIDSPGRTPPRFPPEAEPSVRQAMDRILAGRDIGQRDLAITAGARGADIIGAELQADLADFDSRRQPARLNMIEIIEI